MRAERSAYAKHSNIKNVPKKSFKYFIFVIIIIIIIIIVIIIVIVIVIVIIVIIIIIIIVVVVVIIIIDLSTVAALLLHLVGHVLWCVWPGAVSKRRFDQ